MRVVIEVWAARYLGDAHGVFNPAVRRDRPPTAGPDTTLHILFAAQRHTGPTRGTADAASASRTRRPARWRHNSTTDIPLDGRPLRLSPDSARCNEGI